MDAVHVVGMSHFGTDISQIVGSLLRFGVHVAVGLDAYDVAWHLLAQLLASQCVPFSYRHGHNPCVQFHATSVAFVDGKLQSVVSWTLARVSRQTSVPRLVSRRIYHGAAHTGLQQYGVDACSLQLVQNLAQFVLLFFYRTCRLGVGVWPVDAANGGEPYCAHLMLGRLCCAGYGLGHAVRGTCYQCQNGNDE